MRKLQIIIATLLLFGTFSVPVFADDDSPFTDAVATAVASEEPGVIEGVYSPPVDVSEDVPVDWNEAIFKLFVAIIIIALIVAVIRLADKTNHNISPEIFREFIIPQVSIISRELDELAEQAPRTANPYDDLLVAGGKWALPRVIEWLEGHSLSEDEIARVYEASRLIPESPVQAISPGMVSVPDTGGESES